VNLDLLNRISRATGGAFHHVEDVQALPQLMISDTQHLMDAAARTAARRPPRLGHGGAILAGLRRGRPAQGLALGDHAREGGRGGPPLGRGGRAAGPRCSRRGSTSSGRVAARPRRLPGRRRGLARVARLREALVAARDVGRRRASWRPTGDSRRGGCVRGRSCRLETVANDPGPFVLRLPEVDEVALRPAGRRVFSAIVPALEAGVHAAVLVVGGGRRRSSWPSRRARAAGGSSARGDPIFRCWRRSHG